MTCAHSTLEISNWPNGPTPCIGSIARLRPSATLPATLRGNNGAPPNWPWKKRLLALCRPCLDDPLAVQGKLCRRIDKHLKSLPRT